MNEPRLDWMRTQHAGAYHYPRLPVQGDGIEAGIAQQALPKVVLLPMLEPYDLEELTD